MVTKGNLREVVTTCERSWVHDSPWGFSSGAKKEWGLSPKAKVPVLHIAQLDVTELTEYINTPSWNRLSFYNNEEDDDEEFSIPMSEIHKSSLTAITPDFSIADSLIIEDEHLDTISETKSDELIKSSVENLVPNPSDDDESFSDENVLKEIYLNPLFDEEIISIKIDPHHFNDESDLIESLLNQDSSIISSPKIDSLLEKLSGELAHIDFIPLGINESDIDPDDSLMEEIDIFLAPDDSILPGIENDDYDSEGDIIFLEELLINDSP
nr:hypothetical protein [Tanacetum cinerariifolium]